MPFPQLFRDVIVAVMYRNPGVLNHFTLVYLHGVEQYKLISFEGFLFKPVLMFSFANNHSLISTYFSFESNLFNQYKPFSFLFITNTKYNFNSLPQLGTFFTQQNRGRKAIICQ